MIWILLFSLFFPSNSSFVIPKLDKYTQKHIVDKARSKQVVEFIKHHKKQRKAIQKNQSTFFKEFINLNHSRTSATSDFDTVFSKMMLDRLELQSVDVRLKQEIQECITAEEWDLIVIDAKLDLAKIIDKKHQQMDKLVNKFTAFEEDVSKIITDKSRREGVHKSLNTFESVVIENLLAYEAYISTATFMLYAYKGKTEDLEQMQQISNQSRLEVFEAFTNAHFEIVELTTDEEWKFVVKKMKKLY